ncbi:PREDICTED: integral membrane protein GPR180 [Bactrocera latifrons]|uniref:Transmembrane protein 145 n=1 Tax=Bactrocera latifrons TaxID=174628 RepID=A0A0K8UMS3_BACLA|nr:PREDICTED: integral membrane protein GPR180 [Bactrocera latifrons]
MKRQRPPSWLRLSLRPLLWLHAFQALWNYSIAIHLTGTFHTDDFFKVITKFGFQKAEVSIPHGGSFGYIYGNITATANTFVQPISLVVLDKVAFVDFYSNRSHVDHELACQRMFAHLQPLIYDETCNKQGKRDYVRRVPCPFGQLCVDEDTPSNVIPQRQFTYTISEVTEPRFWYVALTSCYRNRTTCKWQAYDHLKSHYELNYDIYVVNTHPNNSAAHPLTFQFSFDQQNLLEMYMIFLLVYMVLLPVQIYAVRLQKHPVTRLFTLSLASEFVSLAFITAHLIKFAINGVGMPNMQTAGDILDIFSRTTFMLILLLLAKGWAVTRQQINRTGWIILMSIWVPYCAFQMFLYVWDKTEVDIISDIDEYQTWPGWIVLILRTSFMTWFLYELRNTMKYEHSTKKLDFLLHLGASSLVWFIYLPIVAIVALQVSPMWRYKLLLGITNSADCLAYCVMTGLLWPNRSGQYLLLAGNKYTGMDELDEFNEAPHIVRERERRRNSPDAIVIANGELTQPHANGGSGIVTSVGANSLLATNAVNGEACVELLDAEDLDAVLLTDLNKNSHVVA